MTETNLTNLKINVMNEATKDQTTFGANELIMTPDDGISNPITTAGMPLKEIINVTCSNLTTIAASSWIETTIIYDAVSKHAGGNLLSYDNTTGKIKIPANSGYSFVRIISSGSAQMTQTNINTNWAMGLKATINETITNISILNVPYIPSNGGTASSPYTIIGITDVDQNNDTYIESYFANGYNANNKFFKGTNLTIECY